MTCYFLISISLQRGVTGQANKNLSRFNGLVKNHLKWFTSVVWSSSFTSLKRGANEMRMPRRKRSSALTS